MNRRVVIMLKHSYLRISTAICEKPVFRRNALTPLYLHCVRDLLEVFRGVWLHSRYAQYRTTVAEKKRFADWVLPRNSTIAIGSAHLRKQQADPVATANDGGCRFDSMHPDTLPNRMEPRQHVYSLPTRNLIGSGRFLH